MFDFRCVERESDRYKRARKRESEYRSLVYMFIMYLLVGRFCVKAQLNIIYG